MGNYPLKIFTKILFGLSSFVPSKESFGVSLISANIFQIFSIPLILIIIF